MSENLNQKEVVVSVRNLRKSFGELEVLRGVDIDIYKGDVVAVVGPSGCGKSTFLRCLNFLETPDNGVMMLDGSTLFNSEQNYKDSEKILREKRLNFGLVFQSFNLFPQYSVFKNITLAPILLLKEKSKEYKKQLKTQKLTAKDIKIRLNEFKESEKKVIEQDAFELLEKIGLTEKKDSFPCELSGGQCQRVAIARALALKPKILCFDEPTSALDPELTGEVLKVIRSLKDEDRTMIIVTHEMGFAKHVSDKIVFMADGVIEEEGAPQDILDKPKSEKLKVFLHGVSEKDGE